MSELKTTYEWKDIPWRKLERRIFKLQKRIYQASRRGKVEKVRKLQRLMVKSKSAKLLAVRRVTQENRGKKTAGVDGVKSLTPKQRLELAQKMQLGDKAKPTRRVWIPKPGSDAKRPLSIPVMYDRALQTLVKLTLEPEWEARFEPNNYGFRPGRSCHDAVIAIWHHINQKPKWVLDADISSCFDQICHKALLNKVNTSPSIRRQLRAWLLAGVMDGRKYFETSSGVPQGGTISPLLANIALHGMENRIKQAFPGGYTHINKKTVRISPASVIRYADDFVILHTELEAITKCKTIIAEWLKDLGLELKSAKTRIAHTLDGGKDYQTGFDFLGFNIRQFQVGIHQTPTTAKGYKTLITPSRKKVLEHAQNLAATVHRCKAAPQVTLIKCLNPQIRGWANYYRIGNSKQTYSTLDHLLYLKLRRWAVRRHTNKNRHWIAAKYWGVNSGSGWHFEDKDRHILLTKHAHTKVISPRTRDQYVKVAGERSPYDGDWAYWGSRMGKHPELPLRIATLLKQQKAKCPHCKLNFTPFSQMEVHHKDANPKNNLWGNLELVHAVCHDLIHGQFNHDSNNSECLWEWIDDIPYPISKG